MESKLVNWWNYDMVILLLISKALPVPTSRVVKKKKFYHPTAVPGHCSFWPDLTWFDSFLLILPVEPTVCMGVKNGFSIIDQVCSQAAADQKKFWISTPHWAGTADFWPRVKITANAAVVRLPVLNTFFLDVGQKWLWMHIISDFWGGVQPQNAVILITPKFMKFQLRDCSSLENLGWTALEVIFRTVWTWGK